MLLPLVSVSFVLFILSFSNPSYAATQPKKMKTGKSKLAAGASITVKNLMVAYNGQSNAREKFLEYAKKADEEGYPKVGQLFRAAADSAATHARNSAKALTDLGLSPASALRKHKIKSTRENLETAIKSERYKSEKMYPGFLIQAKSDKVKSAITIFGSVTKVDTNRKILFENALKDLETYKTASKGFFVCQICGNVVETIDFSDCPVCDYPESEYKKIP